MRKLFAFALLFVSATAVQGQDPVAQEPAETRAAAEAQAAIGSQMEVEAPASESRTPKVDMMSHTAATAAHDVATVRAPVDFDQPAAQDVTAPRNFWWLVGAIVLGGIILAVLL